MTIADLYTDYAPILRRYAMRLSGNADTMEDLVQDTILRSMAHLELLGILNRPQCEAWLCRTLKNLFIDAQRKLRVQQEMLERWCDATPVAPLWDQSWMLILDTLTAPDRHLIEQHYLLGITCREIAAALGIPATTVRSRLHVLMKRLRATAAEWQRDTISTEGARR